MEAAKVLRGTVKNGQTIELDEPLDVVAGPVEVTVRPIAREQTRPLSETLSSQEWQKTFHAWLDSHDASLPVLPADALRRESLYEGRG